VTYQKKNKSDLLTYMKDALEKLNHNSFCHNN